MKTGLEGLFSGIFGDKPRHFNGLFGIEFQEWLGADSKTAGLQDYRTARLEDRKI